MCDAEPTAHVVDRIHAWQAAEAPDAEYFHNEVGYNYRLSNIQAALGVAQLEQIEGFVERKRQIAAVYEEAFKTLPEVRTMPLVDDVEPTFWLYTVLLHNKTTLDAHRRFISRIRAEGVETRSMWHPIHDLPPYRYCQSYRIEHSPELFSRSVSLPSGVRLDEDDLERCIKVFKQNLPG